MTKKIIADLMSLADIPGLGDISIEVLSRHEVYTKTDLLCSNPVEIAGWITKERDVVAKMFEYCNKTLEENNLMPKRQMTGTESYKHRLSVEKFSTGCSNIDSMLAAPRYTEEKGKLVESYDKGGIECGAVTEVYGRFGAGKSQLGHQLCVTVQQLKENGGLSVKDRPARVLYIDTEKTWRPERLVSVAINRGLVKTQKEIDDMLNNIIRIEATDSSHQLLIVKNAPVLIRDSNIRLIVIDSGTALFRGEQAGQGNSSRKFVQLNEMMHRLSNIADVYNLAVVFINQVWTSMDQYNPGDKAYGGNVVGHATTYRIELTKSNNGKKWFASVIDSPMHGKDEVEYALTEKGVVNFEKKK